MIQVKVGFWSWAVIVIHIGYLRESRMTIEKEMQRRIQDISVELCREMYGKDGGLPLGTRFSRIEDDAIEVADAIGREVMQNLVFRQAAQVAQAVLPCPDCGRPCGSVEEAIEQKRFARWGEGTCRGETDLDPSG